MYQVPLHRRTLLKLALLGASAAMLPGGLLAGTRPQWRNWSGNQVANPAAIQYPRDEDELRQLVRNSSGVLRPFGGSHSFSALVPSEDTLISLEALQGLRSYDTGQVTATFGAGTRLGMASAEAWRIGQSFANEPDINLQSLAGAIATSTHGNGQTLNALSGMVESLRLVTPDGELLSLTAADGDLFRAACCSLGALGIVTEITFRQLPAFRLEEETSVMPLRDAMDLMDRERGKVRHIEFFAFPHGNSAIVQISRLTDNPQDHLPAEDSNDLLELAADVTRRAGWLNGTIQRLVTFFVEDSVRRGPAYQVYANVRSVLFNEMEYTVPESDGLACLEEVCETIRKENINVFFPIEYRYTGADDTLLGMFSGQTGASISVHQYYRQDYQPLFSAVEPIFNRYQGRPHWGKLHNLAARELRQRYAHFDRFATLQKQLDPKGRMLNNHLQQLLGRPATT